MTDCLHCIGYVLLLTQDAAKSQNLPMLREFNDRYTCDVTTTLNRVGNLVTDPAYFRRDSATSKDGEVPVTDDDNVTSLLSQREITCVASSVKPSNSLMMTGCSNGDIILWDVAKTCVINV